MKRLIVLVAFTILYFSFAKVTQAAVFTKTEEKIQINVLGVSTESGGLTSIANSLENIVHNINFNFEENKLVLSYKTDSSEKKLDLNNFEGDIVEIKKNNEADSLLVLSKDNNFQIQQRGIFVTTKYPIEIGEKLNNLTLVTNSGNRYLSVLPYDAVMPLIKTNLIDDIGTNGEIELIELDEGELTYYIQGEKSHKLFDLVSLKADVDVSVSALNGNVLSIDQPVWSRVLNFLKV